MRTNGTPHLSGRIGFCLALGLAAIVNLASTNDTALQDIVELTGAKTQDHNRWLTRLVSLPKGSDFTRSEIDQQTNRASVSHSMAVQTAESLQALVAGHIIESGALPAINRRLKGDRIVKPPQMGLVVAQMHSLTVTDPLVTGSIGKSARHTLLAAAGSFRSSLPTIDSPVHPHLAIAKASFESDDTPINGRIPLATGQMKQARIVAQMMNKAMAQAKTQKNMAEALTDVPATVTAYAPTVNRQEVEMASAFAAVLRPALTKAGNKADGKSGGNVVKISLAPGDHLWADDPLPRYSLSRAERHCLASGVYFEARSEPKMGQQAVAQVILNRVRNPAYPKSVCGVVYQNKRKRNACQFSFACDGKRDKVRSPSSWGDAVKVANEAIDGKVWLKSVGSSSHYHADYVWPKWRRKMRKMTKIGRHIFYRTFGGGWS
jgi:spore germination cell wall hydrolase CwlJ-like protein